jgi:hypothetical protein
LWNPIRLEAVIELMRHVRWLRLWPAALLIVAGCTSSHPTVVAPTTTAPAPAAATTTTSGSAPSTTAAVSSTVAAPVGSAVIGPVGGPVPPGFDPVSVTWISLDDGWVLGDAPCHQAPCTSLLRTRNGGATWQGVPAPKVALSSSGTFGTAGVSEVRFADAANGWIFGPDLWATHDGGVTWKPVTDLGGTVRSLEAADREVYAEVTSASGTHLLASPTGGDSWGLLGTEDLDGTTLLALQGTTGYAFSPAGAVFAFSASGLQQRGVPCGGQDTSPSGLSAGTGNTVAALCGSDPAAGSATKTLMVSNDGGRTWTVAGTTPLPGQPAGVAQVSPATFVVAAVGGSSLLYRSIDGGHAWATVLSSGGGPSLTDLGFTTTTRGTVILGASTVLARGVEVPSELLVTSNAGDSWTPILGP